MNNFETLVTLYLYDFKYSSPLNKFFKKNPEVSLNEVSFKLVDNKIPNDIVKSLNLNSVLKKIESIISKEERFAEYQILINTKLNRPTKETEHKMFLLRYEKLKPYFEKFSLIESAKYQIREENNTTIQFEILTYYKKGIPENKITINSNNTTIKSFICKELILTLDSFIYFYNFPEFTPNVGKGNYDEFIREYKKKKKKYEDEILKILGERNIMFNDEYMNKYFYNSNFYKDIVSHMQYQKNQNVNYLILISSWCTNEEEFYEAQNQAIKDGWTLFFESKPEKETFEKSDVYKFFDDNRKTYYKLNEMAQTLPFEEFIKSDFPTDCKILNPVNNEPISVNVYELLKSISDYLTKIYINDVQLQVYIKDKENS